MAPGTESDRLATDIAREVMIDVLETAQLEEGNTAQATETAVRVLLLAAADLRWDITVAGRGAMVSTTLLAGLDELRDDLIAPPTGDNSTTERVRFDVATCAADYGDDLPPVAA